MQKFSLRRYYALASLVGITTVIVGLSWFSRHEAVQNLLEHQAQANEDITNSFANSIWPQFTELMGSTSHDGNRDDIKREEDLTQLGMITKAQMRRTNVVKVKIYNLNGLTIFSTDPSQIGEDKSTHSTFLSARDGIVVSEISFRH